MSSLNNPEDRKKLEDELNALAWRWSYEGGCDGHRIWMYLESLVAKSKRDTEDFLIRGRQADTIAENIAQERQTIEAEAAKLQAAKEDEAKLREMSIGDLLDGFDQSEDHDKLERALRLIFAYAIDFFDRHDSTLYPYWALCLAQTATMGADPETLDAKDIHQNIAAIAKDMLIEGPIEKWDAVTVAALKAICLTHPDYVEESNEEAA
jgi:hypothetical protein